MLPKQTKPAKPIFYLHGTPITGAIYGKVINLCKGDRRLAALVFYRCSVASGVKDVIRWIIDGITGEKRYALRPCKMEESGSSYANDWIAKNIEGKRSLQRGMVTIRDALRTVLKNLDNEIAAMPAIEVEKKPEKKKKVNLEQLSLF